MQTRRVLLGLAIVVTGLLATAQITVAKNPHHNNGHNALGAKLNQDGKHELGKAGRNTVTAEVKGKKVVNVTAGNLPVRKVKSNKKMAALQPENIKLAANGEYKIAQVEVSYGYCFDDGLDEYCYWFPASDVVVTDTWVEYTL